MDTQIRESHDADQQEMAKVVIEAFGPKEGDEIAELVTNLLSDPTARPLLSLVATVQDQVVGQVLFTNARIQGTQDPVTAMILAPLSVLPTYQNQGIGGCLIKTGPS
ncbi:MAG: N-acetyltransferase [Merismopedia sp. SIO2A8]|nr:N-acetyltransferase [Merismopedia sp. SIO2A8]